MPSRLLGTGMLLTLALGTLVGLVALRQPLSIFAHGFSAAPGIELYARKIAALDTGAPEHRGVEETSHIV